MDDPRRIAPAESAVEPTGTAAATGQLGAPRLAGATVAIAEQPAVDAGTRTQGENAVFGERPPNGAALAAQDGLMVLTAMGFLEREAIEALRQSNGDVGKAADLLCSHGGTVLPPTTEVFGSRPVPAAPGGDLALAVLAASPAPPLPPDSDAALAYRLQAEEYASLARPGRSLLADAEFGDPDAYNEDGYDSFDPDDDDRDTEGYCDDDLDDPSAKRPRLGPDGRALSGLTALAGGDGPASAPPPLPPLTSPDGVGPGQLPPSPYPFFLLRTLSAVRSDRAAGPGVNPPGGTVTIAELLSGVRNTSWAVLGNFQVDLGWLLSPGGAPELLAAPAVLLLLGKDTGGPNGQTARVHDAVAAAKVLERAGHVLGGRVYGLPVVAPPADLLPSRFEVYCPPVDSYGSHHSKFGVLAWETKLRVIIHTANLTEGDCCYKTQGAWAQDFPLKAQPGPPCPFEADLLAYLSACRPPSKEWAERLNTLRLYDFRGATAVLIASVPGTHMGPDRGRWGQGRLEAALSSAAPFDARFRGAPLVAQSSSIGTVTPNWAVSLARTMSAGRVAPQESEAHTDRGGPHLGAPAGTGLFSFVWTTVQQVRGSLQGWGAGGSMPGAEKKVLKARDALGGLCRWGASPDALGPPTPPGGPPLPALGAARDSAAPHIKTYARYLPSGDLAWFLLTSANLSQPAWGTFQKGDTQLRIMSYELGVLILPETVTAPGAGGGLPPRLVAYGSAAHRDAVAAAPGAATAESESGGATPPHPGVVPVLVPYSLPPTPYGARDAPWVWDVDHRAADDFGKSWSGANYAPANLRR